MNGSHDPPDAREANALPPLSYADYREYRRLLRMLDAQQHLNLSAHLYSAYLISRLTHNRLPHRTWTAWPLEDAPVPPQVLDDYPSSVPGPIDRKELRKLHRRAAQAFPVPPDPGTDAPQVLLRACEAGLRRIVHRRIQNEKSLNIEALLEPEPELGGALSQAIVSTVDKYITRAPEVAAKRGLVSWDHLGIEGPARKRLRRLFNRDVDDYVEHIDHTVASDVSSDSSDDDDEPETQESDSRAAASQPSGPHIGTASRRPRQERGKGSDESEGIDESEGSDSDSASSRTSSAETEDTGSSSEASQNDSDASDTSDTDRPSDLSDASTSSTGDEDRAASRLTKI